MVQIITIGFMGVVWYNYIWGLYRTRKINHLKKSFRLIEIKKKENIF